MKIKPTLLLITLLLLAGLPGVALAQTAISPEAPSLGKGVRPEGMGNAFVAMPGQDENAQFYNPAAINDYDKKLRFRFLSPAFDFSPGVIGLVQDVFDLATTINGKGANNAAKVTDFNAFVKTHTGRFEGVQFRLPALAVMSKYFALSLLADSRTTVSFRNLAFTNIEIFSRNDFGGILGGAYGFFDDRLQAGVNLKVLQRYSLDKVLTGADIINAATFGDAIPRNRSTGVGFDLGLKGAIPTFHVGILEVLKPTVGVVWQDVGNTRFTGSTPNTEQSLSAGFALHPQWGNWQFHIANDFRDLNQTSSFVKKWDAGAEVFAPLMLNFFRPSVRIGAHQGYLAAGASFDLRFFKLEFATYGEEAGQFTREKQLRRFAVNLSFGNSSQLASRPKQVEAPVEPVVAPAVKEEPVAPPVKKAVHHRRHRRHKKIVH